MWSLCCNTFWFGCCWESNRAGPFSFCSVSESSSMAFFSKLLTTLLISTGKQELDSCKCCRWWHYHRVSLSCPMTPQHIYEAYYILSDFPPGLVARRPTATLFCSVLGTASYPTRNVAEQLDVVLIFYVFTLVLGNRMGKAVPGWGGVPEAASIKNRLRAYL